MAEAINIIGDIEDAVLDLLKQRGFTATSFDLIQLEKEESFGQLRCPAVAVAFAGGDCRLATMNKWRVEKAKFQVVLVVRHVGAERSRLRDAYALVYGALSYLNCATLYSRDAEPVALACRRFSPGPIRKLAETSTHIAFAIEYTTAFDIEQTSAEIASALESIALSYRDMPSEDEIVEDNIEEELEE